MLAFMKPASSSKLKLLVDSSSAQPTSAPAAAAAAAAPARGNTGNAVTRLLPPDSDWDRTSSDGSDTHSRGSQGSIDGKERRDTTTTPLTAVTTVTWDAEGPSVGNAAPQLAPAAIEEDDLESVF